MIWSMEAERTAAPTASTKLPQQHKFIGPKFCILLIRSGGNNNISVAK